MRKNNLVNILIISIMLLCLSGCRFISFTPEGKWDKSVTTWEFLSSIKTTEDGQITVFDGDFSDYWQMDDQGNEYLVIRSATGYMTIEKVGEDYSFFSVSNNVKNEGSFEDCMEAIEPDFRSFYGLYEEKVLSLYEVAQCFKSVDINKDNFFDYISYSRIEEEKEYTGYSQAYRQRVKPYIYMINSYVGEGKLMPKYSQRISVKGKVDRLVTIKVYSLSNQLCSSSTDSEASGEGMDFDISFSPVYIDQKESYGIHFTPYMDPIESWYLKTYSNGIQEIHQTLVEVENIEIEDASGTLVAFLGIPSEYLSKDSKGLEYVAIRLNNGSIKRIYMKDDYENELAELVFIS